MNTSLCAVTEWRGLLPRLFLTLLIMGRGAGIAFGQPADPEGDPWISPSALAVSRDGGTLWIASPTSGQVLLLDIASRKIQRSLAVPGAPSGLALSPDGNRVAVTCAGPENSLEIVECRNGTSVRSVVVGAGAMAPVYSPDGATVYVCNRFEHSVSVVDLARGSESRRIAVEREPVTAALTPDGRTLFVGNHLPVGRSDVGVISAHVTVIDVASGRVVRQLALPNGGNLIRDVRVSPDGRLACVTHTMARYQLPTTQVERGWMNGNAITLIDTTGPEILNTILLDQVERGAANPWGAAWSDDGRMLVVTHAGTHELSVIDVPGVQKKLGSLSRVVSGGASAPGYVVSQASADVPSDLSFLAGLRQLVSLGGNGPRAVALHGTRAFVANYFSESLSVVDLSVVPAGVVEIPLHAARPMSVERRGEALFNDATLCLEKWQSCASCHSSEARVDALNWDLMNDGKGNPKNTKSLLRAHATAPAMSLGVRANAQVAVRAGIHHILFTVQPEEVPTAIDRWLAGLKAEPSPRLIRGQLSPAGQRGQALFMDSATGCAACHPPPLYTNRESSHVGTRAASDRAEDALDTPTLLEVWRTAPYLHDGSAPSLREVLQGRNPEDQHGRTSRLSAAEIDDLLEFLLSL